MSFPARWRRVLKHIIQRRQPYALMSWHFLRPNPRRSVRLHRRVFLGAWPGRPRWQWALLTIYSLLTWFFFFSWLQIYSCMKNKSRKLSGESGVASSRQLADLLVLALLHGIPPGNYYLYRLYESPRKQWLDYVYTHELPHWHLVLSARDTQPQTLQVITDKKVFAEQMARCGVATVETFCFIGQGERAECRDLLCKQSLFFKPNTGSRGEGCFTLSYQEKIDTYALSDRESLTSDAAILDEINCRLQRHDYLVQPLISNHQQIRNLCGTSELVTLRLVTGIIQGKPTALFASLEISKADDSNTWNILGLNLQTGKLANTRHAELAETIDLHGETLPFWQQAVAICERAQRACSDLLTVGWDVVFTPTGVKLLEGNINWGVAAHQIPPNEPLLKTRLHEVY